MPESGRSSGILGGGATVGPALARLVRRTGATSGLHRTMPARSRRPATSGRSSARITARELDGVPSWLAGVLPGARPVAVTIAARMALNHSATNRLK